MMRQLALELAPPPAPTFGNFVAGSNEEAKRAVEALVLGGAAERFVYLWGVPGSGRTHLLLGAHAALEAAGKPSCYVDCDASTATFPASDEIVCLLADNVERLPPAGQIALFNAYNALRERGAALVAAGDAPPVQLPLRADVVTRLGWGLVYQLHPLTDDDKSRALAEHAQRLGFALQPGVADYLLRHVARDMASLIAALDALDRYSLETKRAVTVGLVRELVRRSGDS